MRVIFLDVDGPMIPGRQYGTKMGTHRRDKSGKAIGHLFDPFSVKMVTHLATTAHARIVWNTMHNLFGIEKLRADAIASGLSPDLFHPTAPQTEYPGEQRFVGYAWSVTRIKAIRNWLKVHPEVTHWVSLDDERIRARNAITVQFQGGITSVHIDKALEILGVDAPKLVVRV